MNEVNILDEIKAIKDAIEALVKLRDTQRDAEQTAKDKADALSKEIDDKQESIRLVSALMEHNDKIDAEKSHAAAQKAETMQSTFDELVGAYRSGDIKFDDIETFATFNELTMPDEHQGTPDEPDIPAAAG